MDTVRTHFPGAFRKLSREEGPLLRDHLIRLGAASRNARFHGGMSDGAVAAYAMRAAAVGSVYVYVEGGKVRGSCELFIPAKGAAEAAVSVEEGWRRRGIGRKLLERALGDAAAVGTGHVEIVAAASNHAMRRLANSLGGSFAAAGADGRCLMPAAAAKSRAA